MSQGDLFDEQLVDDPLEFSGISGSATPSTNSSPSIPSQSSQPQSQPQLPKAFQCQFCKKTLKTLRGIMQHEGTHRSNARNAKRPGVPQLRSFVSSIMDSILIEIMQETENESDRFIVETLQLNSKDEEWTLFIDSIGEPIYHELSKKTKVLPPGQYEEAQKELNHYLNDEDNFNDLMKKVKNCCECDFNDWFASRLVFRISMKLLPKVQAYIAREMLTGVQPSSSSIVEESRSLDMDSTEEKSFCESLGDLFRSHFSKRHLNFGRHQMIDCFKNKFVESEQIITRETFLNKAQWFSGNENSIVVSDHALTFFKIVEGMLRDMTRREKVPTHKEVLDKIFESSEALTVWFHLSSSHFVEEEGLLFLKSLIKAYVSNVTRKVESEISRFEERSIRGTQASLREHLHRNYDKSANAPQDKE